MLECALINHGSPTLARLKTGSLFTVHYESEAALLDDMNRLNALLHPKGLLLTVLRARPGWALMYLYREQALQDRLSQDDIQAFLNSCGYETFTPDAAINHLRTRLTDTGDFPHEIGIFLGYPLADVIGFIENAGQNCLCTGCWKAYTNECEAQKTFALYKKCKDVYTRLFAQGYPLTKLTVRTVT